MRGATANGIGMVMSPTGVASIGLAVVAVLGTVA